MAVNHERENRGFLSLSGERGWLRMRGDARSISLKEVGVVVLSNLQLE